MVETWYKGGIAGFPVGWPEKPRALRGSNKLNPQFWTDGALRWTHSLDPPRALGLGMGELQPLQWPATAVLPGALRWINFWDPPRTLGSAYDLPASLRSHKDTLSEVDGLDCNMAEEGDQACNKGWL